ncbi:MAG: signal peptidase II [Chloroflexota bacterium]
MTLGQTDGGSGLLADAEDRPKGAPDDHGPPARLRSRPRWALFIALAAVVVVLDQVTKALLVGALAPGERVAVVGDLLRLVHSQNSGALFGLFRDRAILFAAVSIVVLALIVWYEGKAGNGIVTTVALGLLLGGAIGNLIDRLARGYVVDFVDAGIGGIRWYTFNVADAAISTAIVLLVAIALVPRLGELGASG